MEEISNQRIELNKDTISEKDVDILCDWLKTYPRLTKGEKNLEFEDKWSKWLFGKDSKNKSVFVNSGSSAILLMLAALKNLGRLKNDLIICPNLAWATDMSSIINLNLTPLICEVNLENLSVDLNDLEEIFKKENPAALLLVSVLGLIPDMSAIVELCQKYDVILLEDVCESTGSEFNGQKLGTFGMMSVFSSYYAHHFSTIEGGLVSVGDPNDIDLVNMLLMLRSHGWDRELDIATQTKLRDKWQLDSFSALYAFHYPSYNFRNNEIGAMLGIGQIDKLDSICQKRNENYKRFMNNLKGKTWTPTIPDEHFVSSFAIPIISKNKKEIVKSLQDNNIECRPLISGSMSSQPMYIERYGPNPKPNSSKVDEQGFYVPNHPFLTDEQIDRISKIITDIESANP